MYTIDEDTLEEFADAFVLVKDNVLASELNMARFADMMCKGHALLETLHAQRVNRMRVAPKPASATMRKGVKRA